MKRKLANSSKTILSLSSDPAGRKSDRLIRHYRRQKDVRMDYLERVSTGQLPLPEGATAGEMVAGIALMSANKPIDDVIQALSRFSQAGWSQAFRDQFFGELVRNHERFRLAGLVEEAAVLLKLGEVTAVMYNDSEWAGRFQGQIENELTGRMKDFLFLKQRGW